MRLPWVLSYLPHIEYNNPVDTYSNKKRTLHPYQGKIVVQKITCPLQGENVHYWPSVSRKGTSFCDTNLTRSSYPLGRFSFSSSVLPHPRSVLEFSVVELGGLLIPFRSEKTTNEELRTGYRNSSFETWTKEGSWETSYTLVSVWEFKGDQKNVTNNTTRFLFNSPYPPVLLTIYVSRSVLGVLLNFSYPFYGPRVFLYLQDQKFYLPFTLYLFFCVWGL